jgi:hypothetical protein
MLRLIGHHSMVDEATCRRRGKSDMGDGSWAFGFAPVGAIARIDAGDAVVAVRPAEEGL